ncbi:MAG: hypothetical protein AB7P04_10575 [Bacteriovoracia bacterium]
MPSRLRLALIAFTLHAPGLIHFAKYRLRRQTRALNLVFLGATLFAMSFVAPEEGGAGILRVWLIGHFAWSVFLAVLVYRGIGGVPGAKA